MALDANSISAIETAFKAHKMSNVKLAIAHNVSEGLIRKMAKQYGWKRGDAVEPPAAKLPPVPPEVTRHEPVTPPTVTNRALTDDLVRRMLDELDATTTHLGELEALIETETGADKDGRRRGAMLKAISLPVRSNALRMLLAAQAELARDAGAKKGKREQAADKARDAATGGKFRAGVAPLRVVGSSK